MPTFSRIAAPESAGATTSIPVVFSVGTDPVEFGLVASFNHPGGNVTGISSQNSELAAKRLGLMLDLLPNVERFAVLVNPSNPNAASLTKDVQAAGSAIGRQIEMLAASTARDIDAAIATLTQKRADALVVSPDPLLDNRRLQIVTLAAHQRLPAIYSFR
jgi:putative ABC transport system substrate-binding protein